MLTPKIYEQENIKRAMERADKLREENPDQHFCVYYRRKDDIIDVLPQNGWVIRDDIGTPIYSTEEGRYVE